MRYHMSEPAQLRIVFWFDVTELPWAMIALMHLECYVLNSIHSPLIYINFY